MNHLLVKLLAPDAIAPTVAHPGEDIAYDIYAYEDAQVSAGEVGKFRTGIAARAFRDAVPLGMLLKPRSGMASKGYRVEGGVIDSRYVGELIVLLSCKDGFTVKRGDKIAQAVPVEVLTGAVIITDELEAGTRGDRGFGSSGR
jgi:dUTP pyrophosphatase